MIEQNSDAWHAWRKNKIGASDISAILGISPYKTRRELFLEKTSQIESDNVPNFIQEKGHRLEKVARAKYEIVHACEFKDALVEYAKFPFIAASLDGYNHERKHHIEVKYVGKTFKFSNEDELIKAYPHYYAQVQYQMLITGGTCDIVQITDDNNMLAVSIAANPVYMADLITKAVEFWNEVQSGNLKKDLSDEKELLLKRYKKIASLIKKLEKKQDEVKTKLLDGLEKEKYDSDFGKISIVERAGTIDYKKIPELAAVDLEKYRGKATKYWSIK
jgi:putative phage-type endonuclease